MWTLWMQIIILLKQIYISKRISVDSFIRLCKQIFDKIFIIQGGTVDNITRKKDPSHKNQFL